MIESERTLKTPFLRSHATLFFSCIAFFVTGCQYDSRVTQESVQTSKQALSAQCYGDITQACAALGTTQEICDQLPYINCMWSEANTCVAETNCDQLDEESCQSAASSTAPIVSCQWQTNSCHGSVNEACRVYGTTEQSCNALPENGIHCHWLNGECVIETDCEALATENECNDSRSVAARCTWGAECYGNLWQGCRQLASTQEACEALGIGCAWFESEGECLPSENCASKNEQSCKYAAQVTYPIASCSWGAQTVYETGTCSGTPTQGGINTCAFFTDQAACETHGIEEMSLTFSVCYWTGSECLIKETVCSDRRSAMLCYSMTPSSNGYGYCEWTPSGP